jgi:hypothetical protein
MRDVLLERSAYGRPELQPTDDGGAAGRCRWEALQQAQRYAGQAPPVEQGLIGALVQRYHGLQPLDPANEAPVIAAYAQAIKAVAERFRTITMCRRWPRKR